MYVYMKVAGNIHQNVLKGIISHDYMIKISLDKQIESIHLDIVKICSNHGEANVFI